MRLNLEALQHLPAGYQAPAYDVRAMRRATAEAPVWVHFGAGNIFRMFPAAMQQTLLDKGLAQSGIIVCESYDEELIDAVFAPYDNLTAAVTLKADGGMEKTVVASIAEGLAASKSAARLAEVFANPSLQMVSFTITEKGYNVRGADGAALPFIQRDMEAGPANVQSLMGLVARLALVRYRAGRLPVAFVSMDNCSHNGDKLKAAVLCIAEAWCAAGFAEAGFMAYLGDPAFVGFPLSMIDKITPRPSEAVRGILEADGFTDAGAVVTEKGTYAACFVNGEEAGYLVIEDVFPGGKPPLEAAGVIFTSRETVDKVEKMKVCTCLNPLHTVLAVFGCLLGYGSIAEEMADPLLRALVERIGYDEGLPVVVDPGIIDPKAFIDEVIGKRFPNPFVPDTPQRIACDTSQKIPVRFGETLKAYAAAGKDLAELTYIPLFFAGWLRYLLAVDDAGAAFEPSPDPMLTVLREALREVAFGGGGYVEALYPLLANKDIFGVDLVAHGVAAKVVGYFERMNAKRGAVAEVLGQVLGEV